MRKNGKIKSFFKKHLTNTNVLDIIIYCIIIAFSFGDFLPFLQVIFVKSAQFAQFEFAQIAFSAFFASATATQ